jgi:hypothetical protein
MGQNNNIPNSRFTPAEIADPQSGAKGWVKVASQLTFGTVIVLAFAYLLKSQVDGQAAALKHGDRAVEAISTLTTEMHTNNALLREIRDDQREFMRRPHVAGEQ